MQPTRPSQPAALSAAPRHQGWWAEPERSSTEPDSQQPRVRFERVITPECSDIFDFILGPSTQGVCQALMGGGDPSVKVLPVETAMLTNPVHEYGPWNWHRGK